METRPPASTQDAHVDVRTGRRNTTKRSTTMTTLLTATIVQSSVSASNQTTFPTTTTWFPVPEQSEGTKRKRSDEALAKSAAQKRKRLGQAKRKRDRIQQEIDASKKNNRKLQAQLTAFNKRITQLQGAQARNPTAKDVRQG